MSVHNPSVARRSGVQIDLLAAVRAGVRFVELGHPYFTGMHARPTIPGSA